MSEVGQPAGHQPAGQLFAPAALGPVSLRNRIIKAATFEGMSRRGAVTDALIDFHLAFAAGGVGMTTPLGRALLREPDLVTKLRKGESRESLCIHCNKCMPTIYRGTHCVSVPPADRPGLRILPTGSAR